MERLEGSTAMLKHYGLTFLPWIALAVISGFDNLAGAVAGLVGALAVLAVQRRDGQRFDALILECSSAVYMAALTAATLANPGARVLDFGASMAIGWLALTAWGTLAVRQPFTSGIARRNVTAEQAGTELFRQINTVLTAVWAAAFTLSAVVLFIVQDTEPHNTALLVAAKIAGFAVPAIVTRRYPDYARKRYFAAHGLADHA
ncbi:hypothetical protein [Actinomadura atramentaria]|uniref:hypothetical protein n=1 Tax=Actinomadura atramentaria TaxID=1990 RepID=UPI001969D895|nr:hypothetical protein [Actinomadura atramentaria]